MSRLDPQRLDDICAAIVDNSERLLIKGDPYTALERRWYQIGGMLELARRLPEHRLVRTLEAHKDALRRLLDSF